MTMGIKIGDDFGPHILYNSFVFDYPTGLSAAVWLYGRKAVWMGVWRSSNWFLAIYLLLCVNLA